MMSKREITVTPRSVLNGTIKLILMSAFYMCARHERTLQGESPEVRAVAPST